MSKWISVKKKLPSDWERVLVFLPKENRAIIAYSRLLNSGKPQWYAVGTWSAIPTYVSHWIPIPPYPIGDLK